MRNNYQFREVKTKGRSYKTRDLWMQGFLNAEQIRPVIGIVATKKLGEAVQRNRAKRIVREIFRKNINNINPKLSLIVLPRSSIFNLSFTTLEQKFIHGLEKISVLT